MAEILIFKLDNTKYNLRDISSKPEEFIYNKNILFGSFARFIVFKLGERGKLDLLYGFFKPNELRKFTSNELFAIGLKEKFDNFMEKTIVNLVQKEESLNKYYKAGKNSPYFFGIDFVKLYLIDLVIALSNHETKAISGNSKIIFSELGDDFITDYISALENFYSPDKQFDQEP